jgi:hypothetical protein
MPGLVVCAGLWCAAAQGVLSSRIADEFPEVLQ